MKQLNIAPGLKLPVDAVTQTFAILGIRGSGKTNTAVVLVEELIAAGQQVVILDPVDVWWGLRSSADGGSGLPLTILGGEHADLPLEAGSGFILADFVVDNGVSLVLSLRHLSMSDQRRFAADFAERLYARKGEGKSRSPLHLVIDECDEFIPQRIPPGGERMFGAFDRIVRRGRATGIGVTMISQRAQVVSKDVLSQIETLVCHRVLHKLDRKALEAWTEAHDVDGKFEEFMRSLASLGRGDAWVWSPEWLGIFSRVHIRARETFDSSATPKAGQKPMAPKHLAPVDLAELRQRMADTIERAKAEDPKELRRQIADLQKQVAAKAPAPTETRQQIAQYITASAERAERRVKAAISAQLKQARRSALALQNAIDVMRGTLDALDSQVADIANKASVHEEIVVASAKPATRPVTQSTPSRTPANGNGHGKPSSVSGGLRRMLVALAQKNGLSARQIGLRAGLSSKSGTFSTYMSRLRQDGLIEGGSESVRITEDGIAAVGSYDPLPSGIDLLRHWQSELGSGSGAARILQVLYDVFPKSLTGEEIGERAGISHKSGTYSTYLSKLRTLELVSGSKTLTISEDLT